MRPYLRPLSYLYDKVVEVKNSLYRRKFFTVYHAPLKVISIGNLTVGGTGKTPVTDFCIKDLEKSGKKVAVISRSYRADAGSACWVDVSHPFAARYYGDEPVLLASANPQVPVYVGPSKWRTAEFAVSHGKFDVLLVDDGFQHLRLHRDLDIVILDATEDKENYAVLPEGRARESWGALERADVIVLSKCNLAKDEDLKEIESRLPSGKEVIHLGYQVNKFRNAGTKDVNLRSEFESKKLFLVSAIARPDVFEKMMREIGDVSKKSMHFRDHHQYTLADARKIEEEFKKSHCDYLVTTEKDAVKLKTLMNDSSLMWSASLEVVELGKKGRLHEVISQALH
ncbi:tetraacyldisaccharide 4'-kinase [Bdellovibrio bacteriovorus]|uniref:Tetraacyldisaccharide 4'-kinase n=1 Tax=Bdellovibrio bacteriovorus TaxID=959 RepID=A0A150WLV8_BDEBC|nr:tetraacyldisaccharide 4'-kinase [Bdellovibrio bacteriovorus]KYG64960.1 tetraacyldisaccharide 4'-kinase [Bdellovibrio bacteriovorus]